MTKKSKSRREREAEERRRAEKEARFSSMFGGTTASGRGQEEFTGDFGAAFYTLREARERVRSAAYREALDRAQTAQRRAGGRPPWAAPRGPMRPFVVGWRLEQGQEIIAMGRTVVHASSQTECERRAERLCLREAHRLDDRGPGFKIRYIKEL